MTWKSSIIQLCTILKSILIDDTEEVSKNLICVHLLNFSILKTSKTLNQGLIKINIMRPYRFNDHCGWRIRKMS